MGDTDKSLKIEIGINATGQDQAKAAEQSLKAVTDETERYEAALKGMADKDADSAQAKRWAELTTKAHEHAAALAQATKTQQDWDAALKEFEKDQHAGGEATGEATEKGRAQYLLMGEMNKVVPELGHLFHATFAGPIGPLIILTTLLADAYGEIKEFNKQLDEAAKLGANSDFLGAITGKLEVFAGAAADAQAFADSLAAIATANNNLNTQLQEQLGLMQAIERAQAAQTSAQKALDIAKIQQDEAAHRITPEKAAEERATIEKKYLKQQQTDREQSEDATLKKKQDTLKQAAEDQGKLEAAAAAARDQVERDKAHVKAVNVDPAEILGKINAAIAYLGHIDELQDKVNSGWASTSELGELAGINSRGDRENVERQIGRRREQLKEFEDSQSSQDTYKKHEDDVKAAEQKAEENKKLITDLTKEIADLNATIKAVRPIERATTTTQTQTVDTQENARLTAQFERDFKTLDEFARSKNPSDALLEKVSQAMSDLIGLIKDHNALVRPLPDFQAAIRDLQTDMEIIKSRSENSRNWQGGQG